MYVDHISVKEQGGSFCEGSLLSAGQSIELLNYVVEIVLCF